MKEEDDFFMKKAIEESLISFSKNEVPIGAVIVYDNKIIARSHNLVESLCDVTAHAEIQAIGAASYYVGGKYLKNCTLYVSLEPCNMCAGAIYWSQLSRLVFGTYDSRNGFSKKKVLLHPKTQITGGIRQKECEKLLKKFFKSKRED